MNAPFYRRYQWFALLAAIMMLLLGLVPAPLARANAVKFDWIAWNLKISFPNNSLHAVMTSYRGTGTSPAVVVASDAYDISSECKTFGGLTISGNAATFAANGYIKCKIPSVIAATADKCTTHMSSFYWFATKALIDPASVNNPIFTLVDGSNNTTAQFNLPRNGAQAQSQLVLPGASYLSTNWNIGTSDNRVLMGSDGPSIVNIANHFASEGWLGFLTAPNWQNYMNTVTANQVGNWSQPQMLGWKTNRALEEWPNTRFVYIGRNPANGTYFTGKLWDGEVDPGCTAK